MTFRSWIKELKNNGALGPVKNQISKIMIALNNRNEFSYHPHPQPLSHWERGEQYQKRTAPLSFKERGRG
jgi:hypothetical protein